MKNRVSILNQRIIEHKLRRMAYEIWENNSDLEKITFVGVEGGGIVVAKLLAQKLVEISPIKVAVHPIRINKKQPYLKEINNELDFNGQTVLLVDDVANSGKTLMYALRNFLKYDIVKLQIAVLVDRKHKSFPIYPNIIGHSISTTLQDHIEVVCENNEILEVYLS